MINYKQQKQKYEERIENFKKEIELVEANWITKRSWFNDLLNFELGENFFVKVFCGEDKIPEDKENFYMGILTYAIINFEEKKGKSKDYLECGFEIEKDLDSHHEKMEHEELLGYLWWLHTYNAAISKKQITDEQKIELDKKLYLFKERISRISLLSVHQ